MKRLYRFDVERIHRDVEIVYADSLEEARELAVSVQRSGDTSAAEVRVFESGRWWPGEQIPEDVLASYCVTPEDSFLVRDVVSLLKGGAAP